MKAYRAVCAAIIVASILGPVSLERDRGARGFGVPPSWAELRFAPDRTLRDSVRDSGPDIWVPERNAEAHDHPAPAKNDPVGSRLMFQEVQELLASHNRARARVGVAPLAWSPRLARYAQAWADHLAAFGGRIEHRPRWGRWKQVHGENLFIGTAGYYGVADAVALWEAERSAYGGEPVDWSNVHDCGHYTQLVWRNTRRLGCAKVESGGNLIVVCNYDPPGNWVGQRPY